MRSAPVENPEGEESSTRWGTRQPVPTSPTRDERVEELTEEDPQAGQGAGRVEELPMDQPQPVPGEGGEGTSAQGAGPEPQNLPPLPATQGQAGPSAADIMTEVVETPLMITEKGEQQEQDREMAAPAGNHPEVPD